MVTFTLIEFLITKIRIIHTHQQYISLTYKQDTEDQFKLMKLQQWIFTIRKDSLLCAKPITNHHTWQKLHMLEVVTKLPKD